MTVGKMKMGKNVMNIIDSYQKTSIAAINMLENIPSSFLSFYLLLETALLIIIIKRVNLLKCQLVIIQILRLIYLVMVTLNYSDILSALDNIYINLWNQTI